jgi:hypothetical protein
MLLHFTNAFNRLYYLAFIGTLNTLLEGTRENESPARKGLRRCWSRSVSQLVGTAAIAATKG